MSRRDPAVMSRRDPAVLTQASAARCGRHMPASPARPEERQGAGPVRRVLSKEPARPGPTARKRKARAGGPGRQGGTDWPPLQQLPAPPQGRAPSLCPKRRQPARAKGRVFGPRAAVPARVRRRRDREASRRVGDTAIEMLARGDAACAAPPVTVRRLQVHSTGRRPARRRGAAGPRVAGGLSEGGRARPWKGRLAEGRRRVDSSASEVAHGRPMEYRADVEYLVEYYSISGRCGVSFIVA